MRIGRTALILVPLLYCPVLVPAGSAQPVPAVRSEAPPRVRLFATGGTISNRAGGRLTVDELVAGLPGSDRFVRVESEQFANTASSALSLDQWLQLARRIQASFTSDAELAGAVVTSGTDTLEELAYFLHLTVRDDRPVVVVGSMRNPSTLGYEGAANLLEGLRVAADPASRGKGTLVVLNDEINSARDVTKTDALRLHTFQSRPYGVLGIVDSDRVIYYREPVRRRAAQAEFDLARISTLPRVDVLLVYQGAPGDLIKAAVDHGAKGIVIATAGAGAISGTQEAGLEYAIGRGVPVVVTTRTGSGRIAARPGRGERDDEPPLVIMGEDLAPVKARILLMLGLASGSSPSEIQRMFTEY